MHAWLVALIGLSFFAIGLPEALLGASWPAMGGGLHAQLASVSFIAIVICAASVASALFARRIVRRLGMGNTVVCSVVVAAIGCAGFAFADGLSWLLVFAVPYGAAAGLLTASLNAYIAPRYAARHIDWLHATTAAGATGGHAILGAVIALIVTLVPFPGSWKHAAGPILLGLGCAPINPAVVHLVPRIYGVANTATVIGLQTAAIYGGTLITPSAFGIIAHYHSTSFLPWYLAIFTASTIMAGLATRRQLHVDGTDGGSQGAGR
ncbi:transporter, putative fucose permease [Bifidobacterium cuniculi]|uniref:Transporter, putative fucose permease n=2 Tax=Bifidobacterium cuniculi TaxID=1688 RepID=A0A087B4J9_9BIFI|nr:transporter, putative fucose permease [Bifidobacterium cuniculi]